MRVVLSLVCACVCACVCAFVCARACAHARCRCRFVVVAAAAVNDTPDTPKLPTGKAAGCDCAQAACIALHAESSVWHITSNVTCNGSMPGGVRAFPSSQGRAYCEACGACVWDACAAVKSEWSRRTLSRSIARVSIVKPGACKTLAAKPAAAALRVGSVWPCNIIASSDLGDTAAIQLISPNSDTPAGERQQLAGN